MRRGGSFGLRRDTGEFSWRRVLYALTVIWLSVVDADLALLPPHGLDATRSRADDADDTGDWAGVQGRWRFLVAVLDLSDWRGLS